MVSFRARSAISLSRHLDRAFNFRHSPHAIDVIREKSNAHTHIHSIQLELVCLPIRIHEFSLSFVHIAACRRCRHRQIILPITYSNFNVILSYKVYSVINGPDCLCETLASDGRIKHHKVNRGLSLEKRFCSSFPFFLLLFNLLNISNQIDSQFC